jgi:hypothetical protein
LEARSTCVINILLPPMHVLGRPGMEVTDTSLARSFDPFGCPTALQPLPPSLQSDIRKKWTTFNLHSNSVLLFYFVIRICLSNFGAMGCSPPKNLGPHRSWASSEFVGATKRARNQGLTIMWLPVSNPGKSGAKGLMVQKGIGGALKGCQNYASRSPFE